LDKSPFTNWLFEQHANATIDKKARLLPNDGQEAIQAFSLIIVLMGVFVKDTRPGIVV
jgi:hypothetical protein